jgi:dTMP kinase
MPAGLVVVVEGLDGCGKSTFVTRLAQSLGALVTATPDPSQAAARAVVDATYGALARRRWYAESVVAAGPRLAAARADGHVVIVDRYFSSTVAYARARGEAAALEGLAGRVVAADLTFFLDVDEPTRRERLAHRGTSAEDRWTTEGAHAQTLRHAYADALGGAWNGRVARLDASRDPEQLVLSAIETLAAVVVDGQTHLACRPRTREHVLTLPSTSLRSA